MSAIATRPATMVETKALSCEKPSSVGEVGGQVGEDGVEADVVDDDEARYLQDRDSSYGHRSP